jgi:DnaJ-class molecular chaperone
MNQNNNLYQILGVNKNASQQQIIKVSQDLIPKSSREPISISQKIDEAIMVLTDPQKKMEYDESGWKDE